MMMMMMMAVRENIYLVFAFTGRVIRAGQRNPNQSYRSSASASASVCVCASVLRAPLRRSLECLNSPRA
uniref:Putative secreted protein n=1 Tax=Anopheles triannulatus TaxID=58253 RepID=A0A2M4B674_9DIPT